MRRWPWHRWTLEELVELMRADLAFRSLGRWQRARASRALGRYGHRNVLRAYYGREPMTDRTSYREWILQELASLSQEVRDAEAVLSHTPRWRLLERMRKREEVELLKAMRGRHKASHFGALYGAPPAPDPDPDWDYGDTAAITDIYVKEDEDLP